MVNSGFVERQAPDQLTYILFICWLDYIQIIVSVKMALDLFTDFPVKAWLRASYEIQRI
jgi:hypothetical protein